MHNNRYLVTPEGLQKAKDDLADRLAKKEEIKNILENARAAGDLSENDGYTLALEDFKNNEVEILKLQDLISYAKLVKSKTKGKVEIGDSVKIKDEKGNERTITLVGENESNPLEGKVSHNSPLGKSILNKMEGDSFKFKTPKEEVTYKILNVLD